MNEPVYLESVLDAFPSMNRFLNFSSFHYPSLQLLGLSRFRPVRLLTMADRVVRILLCDFLTP